MKRTTRHGKPYLTNIIILAVFLGATVLAAYGLTRDQAGGRLALLSAAIILPDGSPALIRGDYQEYETLSPQIPAETETAAIRETDDNSYTIVTPEIQEEPEIIEPQEAQVPSAGKGLVVSQQYGTASTNAIPFGSGYIKNATSLGSETVLAYASEEPQYNILKNGLPQVLIYHTHTTETYLLDDSGEYDLSYTGRTDDLSRNMVRIGEEITKELEAVGITVVHDTTIHDFQYLGSYNRSLETIEDYLAQYPSIEIALDIHRDAIVHSDGTIIKPTVEIDGQNAAQVMIIAGCDDGTMNMPNWPYNLQFAVRLQDRMESMFPGLTRPILFDYRSYNQRMTNGSLLIEVGSHGNTLEEAIYSGQLVGKALASYLDEIAN